MDKVNKVSALETNNTDVVELESPLNGSVVLLFDVVVSGSIFAVDDAMVVEGSVVAGSVISVGVVTSRPFSLGNKLQPNIGPYILWSSSLRL